MKPKHTWDWLLLLWVGVGIVAVLYFGLELYRVAGPDYSAQARQTCSGHWEIHYDRLGRVTGYVCRVK